MSVVVSMWSSPSPLPMCTTRDSCTPGCAADGLIIRSPGRSSAPKMPEVRDYRVGSGLNSPLEFAGYRVRISALYVAITIGPPNVANK